MVLTITRLLFILVLVAASYAMAKASESEGVEYFYMVGAIGISLMVIGLDLLTRRKSVAALSALFFGLLAGLLASLLLGAVLQITPGISPALVQPMTIALTVILSYLCISVILQTKDDFRFVIPYIEFAKETKGGRPAILDTSVIIDGRIADLCETRIFDSEMIVPRFVLQELQTIADSADKLKRNRGRRGLDMLNRMQSSEQADIRIHDTGPLAPGQDVDTQLVSLAKEMGGHVVTNDYNLNKIAQFRGVSVININDMANALKPVFLPGETLTVTIVKPGEGPGQGVGYLEDGTMVVVEGARDQVNSPVTLSVTSVLQTSAGRMIFGRAEGDRGPSRGRPRPRPTDPSGDKSGDA
jgi:uncharacterized protein YacL